MRKRYYNIFGLLALSAVILTSCSKKELYDLNQPQPEVKVGIASQDKLNVVFSNESTNVDSHYWDMGDGTISKEAAPSHSFELPGEKKVFYTAFSKHFIKADLDSISITLEGGTATPESFVGEYEAVFNKLDDLNDYPSTSNVTVDSETGEVIVEGALKLYRDLYTSWGYNCDTNNGGVIRLTILPNGKIEVKRQYMYDITADGFHQIVHAEGFGLYNNETNTFSISYRQVWYNPDGTHDPIPEEFIADETIVIARKKN